MNKVGGITMSDLKTYYIAKVITTVVLAKRQIHRPMEWNRNNRKDPERLKEKEGGSSG